LSLLSLSILAVIQGITEFLPISSSAHLILFPAQTGGEDQGLVFDAAVHVGTLAAVILYFWTDVRQLLFGSLDIVRGRIGTDDARLTLFIALATVPLVVVGVVVALTGLDVAFRSVALIAWTTLFWGVALWLADRFGDRLRGFADWTPGHLVIIGLLQALSIVPGTSRSGITMMAARLLGYRGTDAARLSMLMSVPAVAAVGAWITVKLFRSGDLLLGLDALLAAVLAFIAAMVALAVMMRMIATWSFTPFVVYRMALGAALLWVAYG
jgi:undecaprenyl-diphosphatase